MLLEWEGGRLYTRDYMEHHFVQVQKNSNHHLYLPHQTPKEQ